MYTDNQERQLMKAKSALPQSSPDEIYAKLLIDQLTMRWNILVGHVDSGREAKLSHMDVLEANHDLIKVGNRSTGVVNMSFRKEDILKQGVPQIDHFEIRYFDFKGNEIKSSNPPDMETKGAKPVKSKHNNSGYGPGL